MATPLDAVVIRALDPGRLARFWSAALGWPILAETPDSSTVGVAGAPPWGEGGPVTLEFIGGATPKSGKNAVHLDLASPNLAGQRATVDRLHDLGSRSVDIGQEATPWVVMADPEGNEFCVLDPREDYRDVGPIAAVLLDCADAINLADFWIRATGWPAVRHSSGFAALRHPRTPCTWLELLEVHDPRGHESRLQIRVVPGADSDLQTEIARLERVGARRMDEQPTDPTTVMMVGPQGHKLCLRRPAAAAHQPM